MNIDYSIISAVALGIALSACCGFRIFIPMLAAAIAGHLHLFNLSNDMQWLSSLPAIICFATAAIIEIGAFYFTFLDNILDAIAAPLAIAAGTILSFAIIPLQNHEPLLRWATALIAGGATAGSIHVGAGLLRLFSTKATLGTGNPLITTGENVFAIVGSISSFFIPVVVAVLLIVLIFILYFKNRKEVRYLKS